MKLLTQRINKAAIASFSALAVVFGMVTPVTADDDPANQMPKTRTITKDGSLPLHLNGTENEPWHATVMRRASVDKDWYAIHHTTGIAIVDASGKQLTWKAQLPQASASDSGTPFVADPVHEKVYWLNSSGLSVYDINNPINPETSPIPTVPVDSQLADGYTPSHMSISDDGSKLAMILSKDNQSGMTPQEAAGGLFVEIDTKDYSVKKKFELPSYNEIVGPGQAVEASQNESFWNIPQGPVEQKIGSDFYALPDGSWFYYADVVGNAKQTKPVKIVSATAPHVMPLEGVSTEQISAPRNASMHATVKGNNVAIFGTVTESSIIYNDTEVYPLNISIYRYEGGKLNERHFASAVDYKNILSATFTETGSLAVLTSDGTIYVHNSDTFALEGSGKVVDFPLSQESNNKILDYNNGKFFTVGYATGQVATQQRSMQFIRADYKKPATTPAPTTTTTPQSVDGSSAGLGIFAVLLAIAGGAAYAASEGMLDQYFPGLSQRIPRLTFG